MDKRITIYITSVIHFANKTLSYSNTRSAFSPAEREKQTLDTIKSIRNYIPEATVILLESGTQKDIGILSSQVDQYIFLGDNPYIRKLVDSPFKGAGEILTLLFGLWKTKKVSSEYIIKISGRYRINQNFKKDEILVNEKFVFHTSRQCCSTRLYSLHNSKKILWIIVLIFGLLSSFLNLSIELIFYYLILQKRRVHRDIIGVSGFIGVNGDIIHE